MSEYSNEPVVPGSGPEMSLVDTWMAAFTKPSEGTFAKIVAQPGANATKAFLWVFVASLITSFASAIAQLFSFGRQFIFLRQYLPPEIANQLPAGGAPSFGIGTVICGAPVAAVIAVIGFAIGTALVQWVAKLFGGTGSFEKLAYAFSMITVPYSVVVAVLTLVGIIPLIGILTGLISFALIFYVIVLEILAVKAVDRLDTGKSVGAVLLPGIAILLIICCCVIVGAAVLIPAIRNASGSAYLILGSI
jgi:Yip1 domain